MSKRPNVTALRKRATTFIMAGLGAGAATVMSFAMALYDAAQPKELPIVQIGEPVDTGRWKVAVLGSQFDKERLSVEMEITNLSAMTSNSYSHVLTLVDPPPGLATPSYLLVRDNAIAYNLHPNMPERVIAHWQWPKEVPPPQNVQFTFMSQIHKRRDNLYGAPGWFDRPPVARIVLPIKSEAES
ncbi:hypothetical protein [Taklimakanibacter albus]|uniref:Uncharacterized protein n=1 Tax=Taklimakanibacter albus TaxID=2800327 RepID=A0ACC5QZT7_9HYPH|nr:hypothetical protein [Aestuariivirga sp. YIM B02566]MBK1865931.1 hypothetical protein [Aestuariivirga sp. YIM B02566]